MTESRDNHFPLKETDDIYTVSEISDALRQSLESEFPRVSVFGEITNFTAHTSGHFYFTLRDESCRLGVVVFSRHVGSIDFVPSTGMTAVASGRISHYGGGGRTQLIATSVRKAGEGELELRKRKLLQKLMEEGLTDPGIKKDIPPYPERLAVITSPGSAALKDITQTLARRWPLARIILLPVSVQGEHAAGSIDEAFRLLEDKGDVDAVILARGGGGAEDLWAFNTERVARAVANCRFPVVTGIGHEIDTTVCDYVTDMSVATPTAAAEMISPDSFEVRSTLHNLLEKMTTLFAVDAKTRLERVSFIMRSTAFPAIEHLMDRSGLELDERIQRLVEWGKAITDDGESHAGELVSEIRAVMIERMRSEEGKVNGLSERLARLAPEGGLEARRQVLEGMVNTSRVRMEGLLAFSRSELMGGMRALKGLDPREILERGYAYCTSEDGESIIGRADDIRKGERMSVNFFDGDAACLVERKRKDARWRKRLHSKAR